MRTWNAVMLAGQCVAHMCQLWVATPQKLPPNLRPPGKFYDETQSRDASSVY
jgi:hypothetical protein